MLLLYSSNQVEVYRCFIICVHARGGSVSPGVLRSLLGWKLMGTAPLRNWMDLINPLQMECGGAQLGRGKSWFHVSCPLQAGVPAEFSALVMNSVQSCHQSTESCTLPPLLSSIFPCFPSCTMQSLPESSTAVILVPAASPCLFGHLRWLEKHFTGGQVPSMPSQTCWSCCFGGNCAGQRPQHPWMWIRSCFLGGSTEFSAHTNLYFTHNQKAHEETIPKKNLKSKEKRCIKNLPQMLRPPQSSN